MRMFLGYFGNLVKFNLLNLFIRKIISTAFKTESKVKTKDIDVLFLEGFVYLGFTGLIISLKTNFRLLAN